MKLNNHLNHLNPLLNKLFSSRVNEAYLMSLVILKKEVKNFKNREI